MWTTVRLRTAVGLAFVASGLAVQAPATQATSIPITVSRTVPSELNPPFNVDSGTGSAPAATPAQGGRVRVECLRGLKERQADRDNLKYGFSAVALSTKRTMG